MDALVTHGNDLGSCGNDLLNHVTENDLQTCENNLLFRENKF